MNTLAPARSAFLALALATVAVGGRTPVPASPQGEPDKPASTSPPVAAADPVAAIRAASEAGDREHARALLREAVDGLQQAGPGEADEDVALLLRLAALAAELGSLRESHALRERILTASAQQLPPDHPDVLAAMENLAVARMELGDIAGARELFEEALAARTRTQPADHPSVLDLQANLARVRKASGDLAGARELLETVLEARAQRLPADDHDLLRTKQSLGTTLLALGDLQGAQGLFEEVLEARARLLPPDHPDLQRAKGNLGSTLHALGDAAGARRNFEEMLVVWRATLPADHPELVLTEMNLALTCKALGDLAGARVLEEHVLETWRRTLPADHPSLLLAESNHGLTLYVLGDARGALELFERVLAARLRQLPPDHPELLAAEANLALALLALGDIARAHDLLEQVQSVQARRLPADHPSLITTQQNLAVARRGLGDLPGARELLEGVVEARTRLLPADHPELLAAQESLAIVRGALGDVAGEAELIERVLATWTRTLPVDHPDLLTAQANAATVRRLRGDLAGALELEEAVLAARTRLLGEDHPDVVHIQGALALTRHALGDEEGARALEEHVLAAWDALLPADHPDRLAAQANLASTRRSMGDVAGALALDEALLDGLRVRARALRCEAPRLARESARAGLERLFRVLSSRGAAGGSALDVRLFEALECLRDVSVAGPTLPRGPAAAELADARRAIAEERSQIDALVAGGPARDEDVAVWRARLVRATERRDALERTLRKRLADAGGGGREIDARAVAAALPAQGLAISYLRHPVVAATAAANGETRTADELLAFVVRADGPVVRVELGPAAELERLAQDWRASIGKPLERGAPLRTAEDAHVPDVGGELRRRLIDPLLAAAGSETRSLHVVADDFVHLVPLDALPTDDGGLVGDRLRVHVEMSFGRLVSDAPTPVDGTLVALGGVDFSSEAEPEDLLSLRGASTPPLERSGRPEAFEPLRQTRYEAEDVAGQFEEAFGREPVLLTGAEATKSALASLAPSVRWLHVATHGWFAPETFRSRLDGARRGATDELALRVQETVQGFAPETLCGLALAGANRGSDALGRVPGILTAEELSSLDLSGCELAVLSACETNVGVRRAGQGIRSLQAALHGAGVRTAITSLWKVDDAATRRLMELFYANLWQQGLGKGEALWRAKMGLRAEGHPVRDWAGWVLSGDPG